MVELARWLREPHSLSAMNSAYCIYQTKIFIKIKIDKSELELLQFFYFVTVLSSCILFFKESIFNYNF